MKPITARALLVCVAVGTVGIGACSSRPDLAPTPGAPGAPQDATGTVGMDLQVGPGITLSIVNWTIHNPGLLPADLTGQVDVSQSQSIQFTVGGLPAGPDYSITLTATTDGSNPLTCIGLGTFSIVANETSTANVTLVCSAPLPDAGNNGSVSVIVSPQIAPLCAVVTSLSASPSTADVGGSMALSATGLDGSGSTSSPSFSWAITGGTGAGTFSSATTPSPTFTCTGAGPVIVTATVATAGGASCTNTTSSVTLMCTGSGTQDAGTGPEPSTEEAGPVDSGVETSTEEAGPIDSGVETSTEEAGPVDSGVETSTEEAGLVDSGVETSTPEAGPPDTGPEASGGFVGCDPTNPLTTTQSCFAAQAKTADQNNPATHCTECVASNGCYDPASQGNTCELLTTTLTHFSGALPDGKTCAAVIGTEPVSETKVCLQTLAQVFSSQCAVSLQETPCLCGTADPTNCLAGSTTPLGSVYDEYACDFNSTSGSTINADFTLPTFGAGVANGLVQCAAAFSCNCF